MKKDKQNKNNIHINYKYGNIYKVVKHESEALNKLANCNYKDAESMIKFAAACGALVCGGAGAIHPQPSEEEVQAFLYRRTIGGNI